MITLAINIQLVSYAQKNLYLQDHILEAYFLKEKKGVMYFKGAKFTGIATAYYEDGKIQAIVEYQNGKTYGFDIIYNKKGIPKYKNYNINGKHYSSIKQWIKAIKSNNKNKVVDKKNLIQKESQWYLENSKVPFSGIVLSYHDNGILKSATQYCDGYRNGFDLTWDKTGKLKTEHYIFQRKAYSTRLRWVNALNSINGLSRYPASYLYPNNDVMYKTATLSPFTGIAVSYYSNGQPQLEITFINGFADGKVTRYSPDGKITEEFYLNKSKLRNKGREQNNPLPPRR